MTPAGRRGKSVSSNGRLYLVVTTEAMGAAEEALLSAAARAALPAGIGFTLRRVDAIPAGPGGKARPFVALAGLGG